MIDFRRELQKRGLDPIDEDESNILIPCCFHNDGSNPNLSVSLKNGGWHCWSCHEKGNFFKLIGKIDGVSPRIARSRFWEDMNSAEDLDLVFNEMDQLSKTEKRTNVYLSLEAFHKKYGPLTKPARLYLQGRNIRSPIWKTFDIRFADKGKYKNRVILPIRNAQGKLVSYTARTIIEGVKPKTKKARSPSRALYGLFELIESYHTDHFPYLLNVEGEFDCQYLQYYGIYAVSAMGTHGLSFEQKNLVLQYTDKFIVCYDADAAGYKARDRDLALFDSLIEVDSVELPQGKDPNDLTEKQVKHYFKGVIHV